MKSEKEKLPRQFYITIWIVFIAIVANVYVVKLNEQKRRFQNAVYIEGVITGVSKVGKGSEYIDYKYSVSGKLYKGSVSVSFCKKCKSACCQAGTKVKVRYERNNPQNSDLVH